MTVTEDIPTELLNFSTGKLSFTNLIDNKEISNILTSYNKYKKDCLSGSCGKTSQYYTVYINLVNYYLTLNRSMKTGDFELFKYILPKISNLFFIFNQSNYARWLVKYHGTLMKINETHPEISADMKSGYFGIQRTEKSFSRQAIDLTLEQTIKADAAKRLFEIINFTDHFQGYSKFQMEEQHHTSIKLKIFY